MQSLQKSRSLYSNLQCLGCSTPENRCMVLLQGYHRAAGKPQARNTVNIMATTAR